MISIAIGNSRNITVGGGCYSAHQAVSKFAEHNIDMVSWVHRECQTRAGVSGDVYKTLEWPALSPVSMIQRPPKQYYRQLNPRATRPSESSADTLVDNSSSQLTPRPSSPSALCPLPDQRCPLSLWRSSHQSSIIVNWPLVQPAQVSPQPIPTFRANVPIIVPYNPRPPLRLHLLLHSAR